MQFRSGNGWILATAVLMSWVNARAENPVKVFILAGQSNMVGTGHIETGYGGVAGAIGSLRYQVDNDPTHYGHLVDGGGNWVSRSDVWIWSNTDNVEKGDLSVGYGGGYSIGPELGFGNVLGDLYNEQVLLIKCSWGGKSLAVDFRPPSAVAKRGGSVGFYYNEVLNEVSNVLDNLGTEFPGYNGQGYQIMGFGWHQGWNDRINQTYNDEYEQNMADFIKDIRTDLHSPDLPFVIGTTGMSGWGETHPRALSLMAAQLAMADPVKYPEFVGNVKVDDTRDYWRPADQSPVDQGYHWNQNGETYYLIGDGMGNLMASMSSYVPSVLPYITVDQQTGEIRIVNPADGTGDMDLKDYTITSAVGALNAANWTTIAGHYDASGDGSVDSDGNWTVSTAATDELSESAQAGGSDGLIAVGTEVSLGVGAWIQNLTTDLQFTYTDTSGVAKELEVRYLGDSNVLADLNFDGSITGADWAIFIAGAQSDMSAMSAAQAYQGGDLDGDGDNDIHDFDLFRQAYEAANPAPGAFAQMLAAYQVPEPASILLLAVGAVGFGVRRRRRSHTAQSSDSQDSIRDHRSENDMMILNQAGKFFSIAMLGLMCLAVSANAAISVDAIDFWNSTGKPVVGTFDASSYDKLVVVVTGEHGFPNNAGGDCISVTYDGVNLTQAVDRDPVVITQDPYLVDQTYNDIWFLDNPATSTGEIIADVQTRGNVTVFGLTGTAPGFGATAVSGVNTRSVDLTTTAANSLVIASFGMGGDGNTADTEHVTADPPLTLASAQHNSGRHWDGHVTGYAIVPTPGLGTYSFSGGSDTGTHVIAAEFLPGEPPATLTLQVNTITGATALLGDDTEPLDINYYQITSDLDSLDATGWNSLAAQDFDGNGPPDGSGNGWEEAGGAGSHSLAEAYLLGDSTIAAGALISLGAGYDANVDAQDLVFTYRTSDGSIADGLVEYITTIPGDFNLDGQVEQNDLNLLLGNWGASSVPAAWTATFDGLVDQSELNDLLGNWGAGLSGGSALSSAETAVPEPATMVLLALGGLAAVRRRAS